MGDRPEDTEAIIGEDQLVQVCSYGLHRYGLYSYDLHSYGIYVMAYIVIAYVVMDGGHGGNL